MPSTPTVFDLARFNSAQDQHGSFDAAMAELRAGRKTTHWIWWVFPQVAGLGWSATSVRYALAGREEASAYLAEEVLRVRLVEAMTAVHEQLLGPSKRRRDPSVRDLPDVATLRKMAEEILAAARGAGYPACEHTLAMLREG